MDNYAPNVAECIKEFALEEIRWLYAQVQQKSVEAEASQSRTGNLQRQLAEAGVLDEHACQQIHDIAYSAGAVALCRIFGVQGLEARRLDFSHAREPRPTEISENLWEQTLQLFNAAALLGCSQAAGLEAMHEQRRQFDHYMRRIGVPSPPPLDPASAEGHPCVFELDGSEQVQMDTRALFAYYAGDDCVLSPAEMQVLARALSALYGMDVSILGDMDQMFHRFDFDGSGYLDEHEGTALIQHMLRRRGKLRRQSCGANGKSLTGNTIPTKAFESAYERKKRMGQGGQGTVYLAVHRASGEEQAVKLYGKADSNAPVDDIVKEFMLLKEMDHPRIARTFDIFQDTSNIYVATEPYFGGDLTSLIVQAYEARVNVTEAWLAPIFLQVLQGISYLHSKRVIHCDLKETNVMVTSKENWDTPQVIVIDFGLACHFSSKSVACGTPGYMPPEVWESGLWVPKGDVFAMGSMFYSIVSGRGSPFLSNPVSIKEIRLKTLACSPDMRPLAHLPQYSQLVAKCFTRDFRSRITVKDIIEDPWFHHARGCRNQLDVAPFQLLAQRKKSCDLRCALLTQFADGMNLAHLRELNLHFSTMDKDNSGTLSRDELRTGLQGRLPEADLDSLISVLVGSGDQVSYTDFMVQLMTSKQHDEDQTLESVFRQVDTDGSGYLDVDEVAKLLENPRVAQTLRGQTAEELMRRMDFNCSGRVNFAEFKLALQGVVPMTDGRPAPDSSPCTVGEQLEYYSTTFHGWIPCVVTAVFAGGALQVDVKPDYWMQTDADFQKLRRVSK